MSGQGRGHYVDQHVAEGTVNTSVADSSKVQDTSVPVPVAWL
jgi:hypothetical protein